MITLRSQQQVAIIAVCCALAIVHIFQPQSITSPTGRHVAVSSRAGARGGAEEAGVQSQYPLSVSDDSSPSPVSVLNDVKVNETLLQGLVPRPFPRWAHGHDALCQVSRMPPFTRGLLYLKPAKTGSSTLNGINLRIAKRLSYRLNKTKCFAVYGHYTANSAFAGREPLKSFLWTFLREPTKRFQSQFFHFEVSRNKKEPSDKNYQAYVTQRDVNSHHYRERVAPVTAQAVGNDTRAMMQEAIDQYDFIGVTERFDESVVALQMILGLSPGDVLYLNAKSSGGYDDGRFKKRCTYIMPKFLSPGMKEYFASDEWQETTRYEQALYLAANLSLDMTIESLGRQEFAQKLDDFQKLRARALVDCADTVFPCQANGEISPVQERDCLMHDSGCGNTCLDRVAAEYSEL